MNNLDDKIRPPEELPNKSNHDPIRRLNSSMQVMSFKADPLRIERARSKSECINSTIYDNINLNESRYTAADTTNNCIKSNRPRTFSSLLSGVQRRATSLIFSDNVTRKYEENLMSSSLQNIGSECKKRDSLDDFSNDNESSQNFGYPVNRDVSQIDHLNKRLLDSFLSRINSISPEAYTDDLLMDRILHRVESNPEKE